MNDLETFGQEFTKAGKKNPFRVPDGYFNELPSRVQDFCSKQEKNSSVSWIANAKTQLALAAGICFFVVLSVTGYYYSSQANKLNHVNRSDYFRLVERSGTEFDEIQLYEAVNNDAKKDTVKSQFNEEYLEYFLYNNLENGTLLEQPKDIKP
jgi:hypothetical protein